MLVRPVRPDELAAVGELTVAAYAPFLLGPRDPYAERLRDAAARAAQAELLVAVEDEVVLGTVTLCPAGSPWREISEADEGEFRMLAVSPLAQGRGVGARLTQHCLDEFRSTGAPAVVLSTLEDMAAAHRLYARLGFERLPQRDWEPLPGVRLIAFRKDLLP